MHLSMIFLDGFGLGTPEDNPIVLAETPNLDRLLGGHLLYGKRQLVHDDTYLYSLDATLGVEGIPQSATGQTSLWTGVNTAKTLGYHLNAYPNQELIEIIDKHSLFKQLDERSKRVGFANAFTQGYEKLVEQGLKRHSASTLCALAGGVRLRRREDLLQGKAVYQDITNEIFQKRGEDVPLIHPVESGKNLANLSLEYDFLLFEYFQTDIRGHRKSMTEAIAVIENLDQFIGGYLCAAEAYRAPQVKMALLITSDHGNIEDLSTPAHTMNKVPAICWSNFGLEWPIMEKIEEVTPVILDILTNT